MTDEQRSEDGKVPAQNIRFTAKVTGNAKVDDPEFERVQREIAVHFLKKLDLEAKDIPKSAEKTPDYYVRKKGEKKFICEMKSLMQSTTVQSDVKKALKDRKGKGFEVPEGGCSIKVPSSNPDEPGGRSRIVDNIRKAAKQIKSFDSGHKYPRVLLFCNYERDLSVNDLAQLLGKIEIGIATETGQEISPAFFVSTKSSRVPVSLEASERGPVRCPDIDLFIWVEVNLVDADMVEGKLVAKHFSYDPSASFIWNKKSEHFEQLLKCFCEGPVPRWSCRQLHLEGRKRVPDTDPEENPFLGVAV